MVLPVEFAHTFEQSALFEIVINGDGHSGTFATNDGKTSGKFDCGAIEK